MSTRKRQWCITHLDLESVVRSLVVPGVGVQASLDHLFQAAFFGRDSIRFGRDFMKSHPKVVLLVLDNLISFQARNPQVANPLLDAEYCGKIHHEARFLYINGRRISEEQENLFRELASKWGGDEASLVYYGATDTTLDFITLLCSFLKLYPRRADKLLARQVRHALTGETRTYSQALRDAIAWLEYKIEASPLGLVESNRTNPDGIKYPFWRDGSTAYLHEDGELANWHAPIDSFEIQAKAFDALIFASEVMAKDDPNLANHWKDLAARLRSRTLDLFWMEDRNYFAMAIDRTPIIGGIRLLKTISSLPSEVLETRFFEQLQVEDQRRYISPIVQRILSPEFLTDAGVRCLSTQYCSLLPYWFYHGPNAVWPVSNNVQAIGLRRYGFHRLALELEKRIVNSINLARGFYELFYVDEDRVNYDPHGRNSISMSIAQTEVLVTNNGEASQAWTVSAMQRISFDWLYTLPTRMAGWIGDVENEILESISQVPVYVGKAALTAAYPKAYAFTLNLAGGQQEEKRYVATHAPRDPRSLP